MCSPKWQTSREAMGCELEKARQDKDEASKALSEEKQRNEVRCV